jgi:hypothetical protein
MDWQFILTRLAEPHVPAVVAIGLAGLAVLGWTPREKKSKRGG